MANYLSIEKQLRFNQLIALFSSGDISDELEAELIMLQKELKQNKIDRVEKIAYLINKIEEIGADIVELYSADEIALAAQNVNIALSDKRKDGKKEARPSDSNEVLLILRNEPGEKGPSQWRYRQGRIYERASGTTSQPWAMREKQFPSKLLKIGTSAEQLRPYFTPAGAAYFASAAGQAELAKLIEVTLAARQQLQVA